MGFTMGMGHGQQRRLDHSHTGTLQNTRASPYRLDPMVPPPGTPTNSSTNKNKMQEIAKSHI